MSRYNDENMGYIIKDMLIYGYNFNFLKDKLVKLLNESDINKYNLKIILKIVPPDVNNDVFYEFCQKGIIKSHQQNEILVKIRKLIKGALDKNLNQSFTRFPKFKENVKVKLSSQLRKFIISIKIKNIEVFNEKSIFTLINQFNDKSLGYCNLIKIIIFKVSKDKQEQKQYFQDYLTPYRLVDNPSMITINEMEKVLNFYSHPLVKEILDLHFFPYGKDCPIKTEITIDILKEDTAPQKRRRLQMISGNYVNFHELYTKFTTQAEFIKFIRENKILAFYPGVRSVLRDHMVSCLIDIDMSKFLRDLIDEQTLWSFTLTLTREIIENAKKFGLKKPLVIFSGKRGVHLLWRLTPDCVSDQYKYINKWQVYLLPAQKTLTTNLKSLLHNKFTFFRVIMEAILLYTIYTLEGDKIQEEIQSKLGLIRVLDLFILSPFAENSDIAILLDTSANNASVHRIFSFHPSSGRIAIPITEPKNREIIKGFEDYEYLMEESKSEKILENLNNGDYLRYFQVPPYITKDDLERLLRPDALLPYIAFIVRFSERWATDRTQGSYNYWIKLYSLKMYYGYILNELMLIDFETDTKEELENAHKMTIDLFKNSNLNSGKHSIFYINKFFNQKISYRALNRKLTDFYNWEFYYELKYEELMKMDPSKIKVFMKDQEERRKFLKKFYILQNIVETWANYYSEIIIINPELRTEIKDKALELYHRRLVHLKKRLEELNLENISSLRLKNLADLAHIICLYNILIEFKRYFLRAWIYE
ncbi:MAG: hypothetical protein EU529_12055 [Promethearchaeota archaeon]|nr:MAG: hypothetical protein EU529_12055 [Candidatus Lokiarchaeota archaeon]